MKLVLSGNVASVQMQLNSLASFYGDARMCEVIANEILISGGIK